MNTLIKYVIVPQNIKNVEDKILAKAIKMPKRRYVAFLELSDKKAKIENVIAYYLLFQTLKEQNVMVNDLDFTYSSNGKPYFKNSNIKFSITHSDNVIALAISDDEVGIDVEKIKDIKVNLIEQVYSTIEKNKYKNNLLNKDFFCKTWTIKECFVKWNGEGLNIDFDALSFNLESNLNQMGNLFIQSYKIQDFYLSVCSKSKKPEILKLEFKQLFS